MPPASSDDDASDLPPDAQAAADALVSDALGPEAAAAAGLPPDAFHTWCEQADAIRATTKRLVKAAVLERYLPSLPDAALATAARFFSGQAFPRHDMRVLQVGHATLAAALLEVTGAAPEHLHERSILLGELGDTARELLAGRPPSGRTLAQLEAALAELAATRGAKAKGARVVALLEGLGALEAQYAVKLLLGSGELRIGLLEAQVEEALARTFGRTLEEVRRAALLRGDVGEVAVAARSGTLAQARLALFHPLGFMLAQPLPTAEEVAAALPRPFAVEDKYDGIRAQAHVQGGRVALYSRTLDDITRGYPDVVAALLALSPGEGGPLEGCVLDGELLAYTPGEPLRALPFREMQRRLGRKSLTPELLAEVPVGLVVYDVIARGGELCVDLPYRERRALLEAVPWGASGGGAAGGAARLAPMRLVETPAEVDAAFDAARGAGNEGLIAKDPGAPYTPGRRGKAWVKLKKATETLDVVITGAERGSGRRARFLSDYTFAVRAGEGDPTLLNVGKAYQGLTDAEVTELSRRLEAATVQRFGRFHQVRPEIVLEVTFDYVQPSARHKAGYALRFPRILRIRDDKPTAEVDTLARVAALAGAAG
jgi:DNA ligase-1